MRVNDELEQAFRQGLEAGRPKWIPVDDRLPEDTDEVLILYSWYENGSCEIGVARYMGLDFRLHEDGRLISTKTVTHWMPIPKYPEWM